MSSDLPVPVRFALPGPQWEAVEPESLGVTNAAFLAVRRDTPGGYSPTITVSGDRRDDPFTLEQIGNESLALLGVQGGTDIELVKRQELGTPEAPALAQSLGASVQIDGRAFDIRQAQAIQALIDVDDPVKRVVLIYTFTSTYKQFDEFGPEFQQFMSTVEVVTADADQAG